jgi:hypothetical protein
MRGIMQWMTLWVGACMACAQGTLQVLPGGYASVEGNSASGDLFRTNASVFQQVYSASAFSFLGGATGRIDGMAFRFDGGSNQNFVAIWPSVSVFVGTGSRSPDSLGPQYSDNENGDSIRVYGGSLTLIGPSESGLRSFQLVIPFSTPFFYNPSQGNLSVYVVTSPGPTNLFLDGQLQTGDSVGRVFGDFSTVGTTDTLGLITRFDITPIPEPSTWALAISFVLCLWLRKPRLSRNRDS